MSEAEKGLAARRARKKRRPRGCPICGKPPLPEHHPFCSARCKQIDLGRWLGETYRVPSAERPESDRTGQDGEE